MKLLVAKVEMRVIKTITRSKSKGANLLLSSLSPECFHYPAAREAYNRLTKLVRTRTEVPTWEELINDPVIAEDNRAVLQKFKKPVYKSKEDSKKALATLDKYRKIRQLYFMSESNIKALHGQNVDVDELVENNADVLARSRTMSNKEDYFFHFGTGNNVDNLVKRVLRGEAVSYIPTGFKVFDDINHGIPNRSLSILAGATSAGKSTIAQQLSRNMAEQGYRVCYIPLEMDEDEMTQRRLANLTDTPLHKITAPKKFLNKEDEKRIWTRYRKYVNALTKIGAVETYFPPPEDMTIEELLMLMKPYGYDVIIIDYIGLLKGVGGDAAWQKLGDAARFGKIFAKNNDTRLILCAQLSDEGQIRYSKAVREHANIMWAWTRNEDVDDNIVYVDQQKCRMGKRFKFPLFVNFETMTVRDLSDDEMAAVAANDDNDTPVNVKKFDRGKKDEKKKPGKFAGAKTVDDKYLAA